MNLWNTFCQLASTWKNSFPEETTWVLGFSGGLDSCVLLDLATRFRNEQNPSQRLLATHLHHHIRGKEADADATFCQKHCDEQQIPFHLAHENIPKKANSAHQGLEESGRNARHSLFATLSREHAPVEVLLAHHADDQIESILLNCLRGCGAHGLAGMREQRNIHTTTGSFRIIRPLLPFTKSELLAYANARNLSWREDATNTDTSLQRNHMRHVILPELRKHAPHFLQALMGWSKDAQKQLLLATSIADERLASFLETTPAGMFLPATALDGTSRLTRTEILRKLYERASHRHPQEQASFLQWEHLVQHSQSGACLQLPGAVCLRKEVDGIYVPLGDAGDNRPPLPCILPETDTFSVSIGELHVHGRYFYPDGTAAVPDGIRRTQETEWLDADSLRGPLTLRSWQPGDRFHPLGATGHKKVKAFLIDQKIPQRKKETALVLEDSRQILWLWPHRIGHAARVTAATQRVLELSIRMENI